MGIDTSMYEGFMHPVTLRDKYYSGYWMNLRVFIDLRNLAELKNDKSLIEKIDFAYFDMNWESLQNTVNISPEIKKNKNSLICNIFPNPAKGYVNIDLSSNPDGKFRIRIYDISGKVIQNLTCTNQKVKVSMDGMNSSFYYVLVESEVYDQFVTKLVISAEK
jgi:hypothetical protein